MMRVFDAETGTTLRSLIRYLCLGFTAFGLKLDVNQIALIQGALELVLQLFVQSPVGTIDSRPNPPTMLDRLLAAPQTPVATSATQRVATSDDPVPGTEEVGQATVTPIDWPVDPRPGAIYGSVVDQGAGYVAPLSGEYDPELAGPPATP